MCYPQCQYLCLAIRAVCAALAPAPACVMAKVNCARRQWPVGYWPFRCRLATWPHGYGKSTVQLLQCYSHIHADNRLAVCGEDIFAERELRLVAAWATPSAGVIVPPSSGASPIDRLE